MLGGEARFLCQVTSDSVTYVRWHFKRHHAKSNAFDNKTTTIIEITSIAPVKILTTLGPNTLNGDLFKVNAEVFVQNVSFHDEGEYICEAFNQLGSVSWSAFLIAVKGTFFLTFYFILRLFLKSRELLSLTMIKVSTT